jgi:hypothetical protein
VAALAAVATGCGPTQPTPAPRDLVLTGTSQLVGIGATRQWTVRERLTNWTETDIPGQAEWASSDPKVASVSSNGLITSLAFGTTVISVHYQSAWARKTLIVSPLTPVGLGVPTDLAFTAVGETRQLTAVVRSNDDSTVDVTADAQWSSNDPSIVTVTPSGTATTTGFGSAAIRVQYGELAATASISVFPPGTFLVSGRVRLPGNGGEGRLLGVPDFTVTNPDYGNSVMSNTLGTYTIVAGIGTHLAFTKTGFEPAELVVTGSTGDQPVQQLIRITAGDSAKTTIFENDVTYDPSPAFHCDNCRLIRVVSPAAGTLHIQIDSTSTAALVLWTNGAKFLGTGPQQLIADVPVDAGESLLYIRVGSGTFTALTLKTSLVAPPVGGLWE